MTEKPSKVRFLCVADMHSGCISGLFDPAEYGARSMKPGHQGGHEGRFSVSSTPRVKWKLWKKMIADVGDVDWVLADGDLVDGPNPKEGGLGLFETDINEQKKMAARYLSMIPATKGYMIFSGSDYHKGANADNDLGVVPELQAILAQQRRYDIKATGHAEAIVTVPTKHGPFRMHTAHAISCGSNLSYLATPLMREIVAVQTGKAWFGDVDLILRAHRHIFAEARTDVCAAISIPGWKDRDNYLRKKGSLAFMPVVGYVVIEVDTNTREWTFDAKCWRLKGQVAEVVV